jgi:hypothetical protein
LKYDELCGGDSDMSQGATLRPWKTQLDPRLSLDAQYRLLRLMAAEPAGFCCKRQGTKGTIQIIIQITAHHNYHCYLSQRTPPSRASLSGARTQGAGGRGRRRAGDARAARGVDGGREQWAGEVAHLSGELCGRRAPPAVHLHHVLRRPHRSTRRSSATSRGLRLPVHRPV